MIGDRIKSARESAGMSQSDLARAAGIPRQYVSAWESGLYEPTNRYLVVLSNILNITLDELMKGEER